MELGAFSISPGWDSNAQKLASFADVRDLQRQLKAQSVRLQQQADESTSGPTTGPEREGQWIQQPAE
jgi:hypothetical protein